MSNKLTLNFYYDNQNVYNTGFPDKLILYINIYIQVVCAVGECRAVLKYCGNTTNLASHLRTQHPLVYSKYPMAKKKLVADHNRSELASSSQTSSDQPRIKDAFQMLTKLPASSKRARELTAAVAYFIAKVMQAISVVQGMGFQDMVRHFEL